MSDNTAITPRKPRKIQLTRDDKEELLRRQHIEEAVSYFLDLTQDRTLKQIADGMNMSVSTLKRLTQDPYFQEVYDATLMQLGHHPRLQALNSQLPDLIPTAYQALRRLLSPGTAHTAQVAAVKLLFDTLKVSEMLREDNPEELSNFMASKGVIIQQNNTQINVNLPIPEEYKDAFRRLVGAEEIAIDATDIPTSETEDK